MNLDIEQLWGPTSPVGRPAHSKDESRASIPYCLDLQGFGLSNERTVTAETIRRDIMMGSHREIHHKTVIALGVVRGRFSE